MFDIGGWELLVIAALALIVVGPKDLPKLIRSVGQWVGKARKLASDFQRGMDNAAREADLIDEGKSLKNIGSGITDSFKSADRDLRNVTGSGAKLPEDASAKRASSAVHPAPPTKVGATAPAPAPAPHASESAGGDAVLRDFERGMRSDG